MPDMYLNAGGVTVSYFEWLKNLSHVRFGRMEKRYEEMSAARMVKSIESATGKSLGDAERKLLIHGAAEEDLVNSGLEETMSVRLPADPGRAAPQSEGAGSAHGRFHLGDRQDRRQLLGAGDLSLVERELAAPVRRFCECGLRLRRRTWFSRTRASIEVRMKQR